MSKLLDQLKAEFTGNKKASFSNLVKADKKFEELEPNYLYQYKIQAIFGISGHCKHKDIDNVYDVAYKKIKQELYGEIQDRFRELEFAIYEEDRQKIDMLLREINREIFV